MVRIKSTTDAPDFKSLSRHANGRMGICVRWRNAENEIKNKQISDFILTVALKLWY